MALKKLTTFAFAALVFLAGSAQLSASQGGAAELSPNLHIVPKSQKADKKTGPGFMAFLKRSATGLGQTLVAAVKTGSQTGSKLAQKPRAKHAVHAWAKQGKKSDVRVALPGAGLQLAPFSAMEFQRSTEPAAPGQKISVPSCIRLFEAKTGSLPPPGGSRQALMPQSGLTAGLKEDYSLLQRLWHLLRPGVSLRPERSPHAYKVREATANGPVASYAQGLERLTNGPEIPTKAPAIAKNSIKFHLTIDPAQAAILLTHGPMGAGSALRRHRSRDHRSQSV